MNFLSTIYSWLGLVEPMPEDATLVLTLSLGSLRVGTLRAEHGEWVFSYSPEFRSQTEIKPIVDFPDTSREYRSKTLWPFFALRIPSPAQPAVQEYLNHLGVAKVDEGTLLKEFGRRSIANPFELVPAAA